MAQYLTEQITAHVPRTPAILHVARRWRLKAADDPAAAGGWIAHATQWRRPRRYRAIRAHYRPGLIRRGEVS